VVAADLKLLGVPGARVIVLLHHLVVIFLVAMLSTQVEQLL
jgi:hypothetical protein